MSEQVVGAKARVKCLFQHARSPLDCGAGDGVVNDGVLMTDGTVWHNGCWDSAAYELVWTPLSLPAPPSFWAGAER